MQGESGDICQACGGKKEAPRNVGLTELRRMLDIEH
jgi:hypothetical protein